MIKNTNSAREILGRDSVKKSRLKFFLKVLILILIFCFLTGIIYIVLYSDFFLVKDFEVKGVEIMPAEEIISLMTVEMLAKPSFLSWLGPDNLLFWFRQPNKGIYSDLYKIRIKTDILKRKVVLEGEKRKMFGIWCFNDNKCYVFDREGVIFNESPQSAGSLILKVSDQRAGGFLLGQMVLPSKEWRNNFLSAVNTLKENGFKILNIQIPDLNLREWKVLTSAGINFYFSFDFTPANLSEVIKNLNQQFDFGRAGYFDFRVPNRVYYRPEFY